MTYKKLEPKDIHMTPELMQIFFGFITGDDLDFYEEHIIHLSDEEQEKCFDENPKFMSIFPVSHDRMYLLKDSMFRGILRKINRYGGGKGNGFD